MKVRLAVSSSIILLCILAARGHGQSQTTTTVIIKNPTIGKVLWWQARQSIQAGLDFAAAKAEFSRALADARAQYFKCYPNCPGIKASESTFSELLWEKDLYYMYLQYVGGSSPAAADQLTGTIDGGISENCGDEFAGWVAAMEVDSGHFTVFQGPAAPASYDARKFLRALDLSKDDYAKYQACRDREEFRLHARPPYNNIPAPARKAVVIKDSPDTVYFMSEHAANAAIMNHCRGMNDVYGNPYLTADEQRAATAAQNETSAKIAKCIPEYDAQAILSNRKAALEYCLHANNYLGDGRFRPRFDACMNQNDMLTAMCTQEMRFKVQFSRRQFPGQDPNPSCYGPQPKGGEIQAILRAPSGGAAPGLPAKFLAPPPLVPNPRNAPPVTVADGSVLQGTVFDAIYVDAINVNHPFHLHLDTAQANLPAGAYVYLRVKILGPGTQPSTVRLSITTDYVEVNDKRINLHSDEIVQTIRSSPSAPGGPAIDFRIAAGTRLSFRITSSTR